MYLLVVAFPCLKMFSEELFGIILNNFGVNKFESKKSLLFF
jgi:hypothetical protein